MWQPGQKLQDVEDDAIIEALKHHNGNRSRAAKALGITYRTMARKIVKLRERGIEVAAPNQEAQAAG